MTETKLENCLETAEKKNNHYIVIYSESSIKTFNVKSYSV